MRVLFWFSGRLGEARGTPSRARNLAVHLGRREGVDLTVISGDGPRKVAALEGLRHTGFEDPAEGRRLLASTVAEWRPQVVYGQTHKALPLLAGLRSPGGPLLVADLHGDLAAERLEQTWRPLPRRLLGFVRDRWLERRDAPGMDAFTVVSQPLAERTRRWRRPTHVLWGGVDPESFAAPEPPPAATLRVGYAGNFRPYQGVGTLLDAADLLMAEGRPVSFTFVGDLDAFPEVAERARRSLGERLISHGSVAYERVATLLADVDVLVIPRPFSRSAHFGFPSKLAEYLALGRPVVATRVGDPARVIDDGENGLLVPPGDAAALAAALRTLESPELRRRLGRAGHDLARRRLSWSHLAGGLDTFLRAQLAQGAVENRDPGLAEAGP